MHLCRNNFKPFYKMTMMNPLNYLQMLEVHISPIIICLFRCVYLKRVILRKNQMTNKVVNAISPYSKKKLILTSYNQNEANLNVINETN